MNFKKFDFRSKIRLSETDTQIELFPILNIVILFVILFCVHSRFILSPGVGVSLPSSTHASARETLGVITVQSQKFIMFEGEVFSLQTLPGGIQKFLNAKELEDLSGHAILVRADQSTSINLLIKICDIAKAAGCDDVHIATCDGIIN